MTVTCLPNVFVVQFVICLSCVLGTPPAPVIRVIPREDFLSFNVTLSTTGPSARCVLYYSLTVTENGEQLTTMAIGSSGTGSVGSLNLCKNTYTFSAVGVTMSVNSNSSDSVPGPVNFSGI